MSWEDLFVDCANSKVEWVEVQIRTRNGKLEKIRKDVLFSEKKVSLGRNPCYQHQVWVALEPKDKSHTATRSLIETYNEKEDIREDDYFKEFYSGLLNSEVVQKTCLKRDSLSVKIPDPPESIDKCILVKRKDGIAELGKPLRLFFQVVNPEEQGLIEIHAVVDSLKNCPEGPATTEVNKVTERPATTKGIEPRDEAENTDKIEERSNLGDGGSGVPPRCQCHMRHLSFTTRSGPFP